MSIGAGGGGAGVVFVVGYYAGEKKNGVFLGIFKKSRILFLILEERYAAVQKYG